MKIEMTMFSIAIAAIGFCGYTLKQELNASVVYSTCQQSRTAQTLTEGTCASTQVKYGYEYLCKDSNASTDNQCWVERNTDLR